MASGGEASVRRDVLGRDVAAHHPVAGARPTRDHRHVAGERPQRRLVRGVRPPRPLLRRQLVAVGGHRHRGQDGADGPAPSGRVLTPVIAAVDLTKTFGTGRVVTRLMVRGPRRAAVSAPDGVTFTVERGEIVALTRANGSGKSTLLRV